jgi:hypothetical protein
MVATTDQHPQHAIEATAAAEERTRVIVLRLEDLPATPCNLERIRERIRLLNRRLADSGTPFQLRVV